MRIWKLTFTAPAVPASAEFGDVDRPEPTRHVQWHPTRDAASRARTALWARYDTGRAGGGSIVPVEVPTLKAALIAWLNLNAVG